ncbi:MAG: hypothetical protein ACYS6W_07440 [Planctomycetota bacterium]
MTATVKVAGPFKVERKPSSIAIEASTYAVERYVRARSWKLVSVIVLLLIIMAVFSAVVLVIVAVIVLHGRRQRLKGKTQEGEIRDQLKAGE